MSDQNTGGDGSVKWSVDAENVKLHESKHLDNGRLNHHGVDRSGVPGKDWFSVSIEIPHFLNGDAEAYLAALRDPKNPLGLRRDDRDPSRIYFNLPIEKMNHDQIRVSWGNSSHVLPPNPNPERGR
jgi:hypothetical protein